jgi:hypothetical protein
MSDITSSAADPEDIETVSVGFFRFKERKGAPWQPLRIMRESGTWVAILNGEVVKGSGSRLARDIPFLLWRSPFHPISEPEYDALLRAYKKAPTGHPLRQPGDRVDLRAAPPLYGGRKQ